MLSPYRSKDHRWNLKIFLYCWFLLNVIHSEVETVDDRSFQNLTSFPHDTENTTTVLKLNNNYIEGVDFLEPLPFLKTIILDFNYLTTFPDFVNVSTTLEAVHLNNNRLRYIKREHLDQLVMLQTLSLSFNRLTSVPDVYGPPLKTLDLAHNDLISFPYLSALGRDLVCLNVSYNSMITEIPAVKLFPLVRLENLAVNGLNLGSFPDVRPIRKTLQALEVNANNISWIDIKIIVTLTNLNALSIDYNNIDVLPNICMMPSSQTVRVSATNNPVRCDYTARWMKVAEEDGLVSLSLECRYPPKLNGVRWSDIKMTNLTESTGVIRRTLFKETDVTTFVSVPRFVREEKKARDLLTCSIMCLEEPTCVMFKYERAASRCLLADPYYGEFINFFKEPQWHILFG